VKECSLRSQLVSYLCHTSLPPFDTQPIDSALASLMDFIMPGHFDFLSFILYRWQYVQGQHKPGC
jgi:hypothetical protein